MTTDEEVKDSSIDKFDSNKEMTEFASEALKQTLFKEYFMKIFCKTQIKNLATSTSLVHKFQSH